MAGGRSVAAMKLISSDCLAVIDCRSPGSAGKLVATSQLRKSRLMESHFFEFLRSNWAIADVYQTVWSKLFEHKLAT